MSHLTVKVNINDWGLSTKMESASKRAEYAVTNQAAKDTEKFVPMLTGSLKNRTRVIGSKIIYPGPYAQYLYYGKVMVNAATGKGPSHFEDESGNEVIRFRKGTKLRSTNRDLKFTKAYHKDAQSHWFEASKSQNLDKWKRVAAEALKNGKK